MRSHKSHSRTLSRALAALAVATGLAASLSPLAAQPSVKPDPARDSAARVARLEADLAALQAEAARNPSRPLAGEMERRLNQMVAERRAVPLQDNVARLQRLATSSFLLNVALALGLALVLVKLRRRSREAHP